MDDRTRGIYDAQAKLRDGAYVRVMPPALYGEETPRYWQILEDEFGIEHIVRVGDSDEYYAGFASVMSPEIDKHFDKEFFDHVHARAIAEFKEEHGRLPGI